MPRMVPGAGVLEGLAVLIQQMCQGQQRWPDLHTITHGMLGKPPKQVTRSLLPLSRAGAGAGAERPRREWKGDGGF